MQIVRGLEAFPPDASASAVALGAFDGIHLGHRAILGTAVTLARQGGLQAIACTFDRHPMEVLQPERAPLPITTLDERLELIAETGTGRSSPEPARIGRQQARDPQAPDLRLVRRHGRHYHAADQPEQGRGHP